MQDLYTLFTSLEEDLREYEHPETEDRGMPFDKVWEIAEQDSLSGLDDE